MPQVPIREGIRRSLEPDNNSMQLSEGANERVVDVKVDDEGGDGECEGDVHGVSPGDEDPGGVELVALLFGRPRGAILDLLARAAGLLGGGELDEVGGDEMAGDEEVEDEAEEDVLAAVVMAADADEDAVLCESEVRG